MGIEPPSSSDTYLMAGILAPPTTDARNQARQGGENQGWYFVSLTLAVGRKARGERGESGTHRFAGLYDGQGPGVRPV